MKSLKVQIKRKDDCKDLPVPGYATVGSSGMDLYADVKEDTILGPGQIKLISTGIYIALPQGYEAQIRPRSGLALKHGISMVNSPGTVDADYRGLIGLIMINHGNEPFIIKRGDRVAQMVVTQVSKVEFFEAEQLENTSRSQGGFGHTGV
ncbi:MAG: dUTP diphosphatase [Candidatus Omnitrophica bacterium]|nr:dUTP diphosphatase [Candidatus Omnitrophota bacterium]